MGAFNRSYVTTKLNVLAQFEDLGIKQYQVLVERHNRHFRFLRSPHPRQTPVLRTIEAYAVVKEIRRAFEYMSGHLVGGN